MQPARFKLHAQERTCNPVQRPNFRGWGAKGNLHIKSPGSINALAVVVWTSDSGLLPAAVPKL